MPEALAKDSANKGGGPLKKNISATYQGATRTNKNLRLRTLLDKKALSTDSAQYAKADSILNSPARREDVQGAANLARQVKSQVMNTNVTIDNLQKELVVFEIQWHKILANSFACIAMFLIGAPLGAIIKKGGLGVPFLVSIFFFIVYYVITMQGEKLAKQETVSVATGVWVADVILLMIGLVFLRQARIDARLFEADFYSVVIDKVKRWFAQRKQPHPKIA
jgi:lipopolysaccharide export system permease protein